MSGEDRLENIEKMLDRQAQDLVDIKTTLSSIAVQDQRLQTLEKGCDALWLKYDELAAPEGVIQNLKTFQASCPRATIRWVWFALLPMAATQILVAIGLIKIIWG
jgi:hypothetical protein